MPGAKPPMHSNPQTHPSQAWPALPYGEWSATCTTLQLWMQIVGKIRLALMPPINHCWGVTLYPTVRGLTTSPMPYGQRTLQIDFDFVEHLLVIETADGGRKTFPLQPMTVSAFYRQVMSALESLGAPVRIWPMPVEIANPIPFEQDDVHKDYDAEYAQRFWRILLQTSRVFTAFRSRFRGKVSPVHLFWGALDLACTRFSGRTAPEHASMPGLADRVTRDAYSHEVSSCGFWPGMPGPPVGRVSSRSSTATPIPSRPATGSIPSPPPRPASTRTSANSCSPMKPCASRPIPTPPCLNFFSPPTKPPQTPPIGTAPRWIANRPIL